MNKTVINGKPKKNTTHRWVVPLAGFLLTLMGGMVYAWGVFVIPIVERFGWTTTEATLPFTVFMVVSAIVAVPAGRLQDKLGPGKISAIGAVLFFVAYGGAALINHFPYLWWLILFYGFVGGMACGLTYACAIPPARKWYPDRPGTAISFAVMGFGLAAVVFAPLKADFLIPRYDIRGTFLVLGIIVSMISLFAAIMIKNPPEKWIAPKVAKSKKMSVRQELSPGELLRSTLFWIMWLTFLFIIAGGLVCIGLIPTYGEKILGLTPTEAALAITIFAGFNGFGRLLAGWLSDRFGIMRVMIITYIIQSITLLCFHIVATILPTLYLTTALLGWGFAVTLVTFPNLTSICFGVKNLGINYGLVSTAFGVGAFAPAIGAWLFDITGNFTPVFVSAGMMATVGLILCLILKKRYNLS